MPQTAEVEYLDGEFTVNEEEPSSITELSELIGDAAVVENVNSNLRYRNKYPRVYKKVSEAIKGFFTRAVKETKTNKDGTVKNILVSENDHLRDYLKTGDEARAKLQELFTQIGVAEPMFVKGERTGGGGKVSQRSLDAANAFFAQGDEKVEDVVSKIESKNPGYKVGRDADENVTPESLARGIMALEKYLAKQATANALA